MTFAQPSKWLRCVVIVLFISQPIWRVGLKSGRNSTNKAQYPEQAAASSKANVVKKALPPAAAAWKRPKCGIHLSKCLWPRGPCSKGQLPKLRLLASNPITASFDERKPPRKPHLRTTLWCSSFFYYDYQCLIVVPQQKCSLVLLQYLLLQHHPHLLCQVTRQPRRHKFVVCCRSCRRRATEVNDLWKAQARLFLARTSKQAHANALCSQHSQPAVVILLCTLSAHKPYEPRPAQAAFRPAASPGPWWQRAVPCCCCCSSSSRPIKQF